MTLLLQHPMYTIKLETLLEIVMLSAIALGVIPLLLVGQRGISLRRKEVIKKDTMQKCLNHVEYLHDAKKITAKGTMQPYKNA